MKTQITVAQVIQSVGRSSAATLERGSGHVKS
ncbi:hypothetical protein ANRL4_05355 [Anaerolineae bacterium]|nr:hypothetical protein ANRL4_05355 [Anaerolineae bacterium]